MRKINIGCCIWYTSTWLNIAYVTRLINVLVKGPIHSRSTVVKNISLLYKVCIREIEREREKVCTGMVNDGVTLQCKCCEPFPCLLSQLLLPPIYLSSLPPLHSRCSSHSSFPFFNLAFSCGFGTIAGFDTNVAHGPRPPFSLLPRSWYFHSLRDQAPRQHHQNPQISLQDPILSPGFN